MADLLFPKLAFAGDHAAVALKAALIAAAEASGHNCLDLGTHTETRVDYPDYAARLAASLAKGEAAGGVLICGTGIGMSIAVNRFPPIRGALCHDATTARLARAHNDANVLILGARTTGLETAIDTLRVFLTTPFEGGRHAERLQKISLLPDR